MDFQPHATYDKEADAVYVYLTDADVARTRPVGNRRDDWRMVDYASDGTVVGVEFLGVSGGIDLAAVPERSQVEELVKALNLQTLA